MSPKRVPGPSRARIAVGGVGLSAMRAVAQRFGHEVVPTGIPTATEEDARRAKLLATRNVSVVLDVGANAGQYAERLRHSGYEGRIVSFEPLHEAFAKLERAAANDPLWEIRHLALGGEDGSSEINVAANSFSSSLLGIKERHVRSAPESAYIGTEDVAVSRLDSIWEEVVRPDDEVFLKLDVQGFEIEVLKGAESSLPSVVGVQAELSLVQLYDDGPTFHEVIDYLERRGFRLAGLEAGHDDQATGEMLQADGIFIR